MARRTERAETAAAPRRWRPRPLVRWRHGGGRFLWDRPPRRRGPEGSGPRSGVGARRRGNTRGAALGWGRSLTFVTVASDESVHALERGRDEVVSREPGRHRRVRLAALAVAAPAALQRR